MKVSARNKLEAAAGALVLAAALVFTVCSTEGDSASKVDALDLTVLVAKPAVGAAAAAEFPGQDQYTGTIAWNTVTEARTEAFQGAQFIPETVYQAVVSLKPEAGFTFSGVSKNSFQHSFASSVTNEANRGVVTITFPATAAITYTVTYNLNGGSGTTPETGTVKAGTAVTVKNGKGLSRVDYIFAGWNTNPGGWGAAYAAGDSFIVTGSVTLYAQWVKKDELFTVSYNANGGTGAPPATDSILAGETYTVQDGSGLSRDGFIFAGWNTSPDGWGAAYAAGDTFVITGSGTLYAQWLQGQPSCTVRYDANGGTGTPPAPERVQTGTVYTVKDGGDLSRSGYSFAGWNTLEWEWGTPYSAGATFVVTGDITLYAQWVNAPDQLTGSYNANGAFQDD